MQTWQTFGHIQAKKILEKQLNNQSFVQTYLFLGPKGLGKKTLALELAGKILDSENVFNHPDFQILDQEAEISAEDLREFATKLSYKPFLGKYKIAIINNAHNLNKTSANALLKTLEEPTRSTIIILIAAQAVLPTIFSRSLVVNFSYFKQELLKEFAVSKKFSIGKNKLDLAFGSTSRLYKLCTDDLFFKQEQEVALFFNKIRTENFGQKLQNVVELADMETDCLKKYLTSWIFLQRQELFNTPSKIETLRALIDALNGLNRNFNKKLVLQGLMTKFI